MNKKSIPKIIEKSEEELAAIIQLIEDSSFPTAAKDFILVCIEGALWFPHVLQKKNMSLKRLMIMLFGKGYKSEKIKTAVAAIDDNSGDTSPDAQEDAELLTATGTTIDGELIAAALSPTDMEDTVTTNIFANNTESIELIVNSKAEATALAVPANNTVIAGHGKMPHTVYGEYKEIALSIDGFTPGDPCPVEDCNGKLYVFEPKKPKILVRIVGQKMAEVRKFIVQRVRCNVCLHIVQAEIPPEVGNEKYDAAFKALIVLQKYYVAVPFYRQENFQKLMGFPLPDSTQWDLVEQVASPFYPIFNALVVYGANGELVYGDDTRVKIQEIIQEIKQNPETKRTGMFTSGFIIINSGHKIALFFNGTNHAGENLAGILANRSPAKPSIIQMCDALSCNIAKDIATIVCNCLSHGFRKFDELLDDVPTPCLTIMRLLSQVYDNDDQTKTMDKEERLAYHQEHSKPTMELLSRYMQALFDEKLVEPNSDMGGALKYMQKHWHKLTRFLTVAGAPLCNNVVERGLKIAIRNRKNAMFYRTCYSAHVGGMHTSIIYTCELNGINPYDYLIAVQQNALAVFNKPRRWLPWNYKENFASTHPPNVAVPASHQVCEPAVDALAVG